MNPERTARFLAIAQEEWARGVHEAPGAGWSQIKKYLAALRFSGAETYAHDGDAQWCGAFAGYCLVQAGAEAALVVQKSPPERGGLGSAYRAQCLARSDNFARSVLPPDVRAGDIVVVGRLGSARPTYGEHIVICTGMKNARTLTTIEGNAYGLFPDKTSGQGVVTSTRPLTPTASVKGVLFGVRFLDSDFST